MDRAEAYQYLRLYKQFQATGIRITSHDDNTVELFIPGHPEEEWFSDIEAAMAIESYCERGD